MSTFTKHFKVEDRESKQIWVSVQMCAGLVLNCAEGLVKFYPTVNA